MLTNFFRKSDDGNALLVVIGIIGVLSIIGAVVMGVTINSVKTTTVNRATVQARAVAEAGLDYVAAMLAENKKPDGSTGANIQDTCQAWLSDADHLTREVGPSVNSDGVFTATILTADSIDGTWSPNCSGTYLRIVSLGTADDKGAGTERGSTAKMVSTFRLPGSGTPGSEDSSDLPGLDLWALQKGDDVTRKDVVPSKIYSSNLPSAFLSPTNKQWIRLISSNNFWQSGTMVFKEKFDAGMKPLELEFNYRMYKNNGEGTLPTISGSGAGDWQTGGNLGLGDGFSFFFLDASRTNENTKPGAPGSGLGYSSAATGGTGNFFKTINTGIKGGVLGIGFDTYGNFQKSDSGGNQGTGDAGRNWTDAAPPGRKIIKTLGAGATRPGHLWPNWTAFPGHVDSSAGNPNAHDRRLPESIGIRGEGYWFANPTPNVNNEWSSWDKGYGFINEGDHSKGGFRWLKGTNAYLAPAIAKNGSNNSNPTDVKNWLSNANGDNTSYRRVKFVTIPQSDGTLDIEIYLHPTIFQEGINDFDTDADATTWSPTPILKIEDIASQPGQSAMPSELYFGMSASSGWAVSTVEIGNLTLKSDGEKVIDTTNPTYGALGTLISKNDLQN